MRIYRISTFSVSNCFDGTNESQDSVSLAEISTHDKLLIFLQYFVQFCRWSLPRYLILLFAPMVLNKNKNQADKECNGEELHHFLSK